MNIIRYFQRKLVGSFTYFPDQIVQIFSSSKAKMLRFLGITILISLLLIVLAQVNIAPVQSQLINLPKGVQQESNLDINRAGILDIGKIRLDGKLLFKIAAPSAEDSDNASTSSPIERRIKLIQFHLSDIIHDGLDPDTVEVTHSSTNQSTNQETIIFASDKNWGPRQILNVTVWDLEISTIQNIDKLAEEWSSIIEQALLDAWKQRQTAYQREQIPIVLTILGVMLAASFGIRMLQKLRGVIRQRLKQQLREQEAARELQALESNASELISSTNSEDESLLQLQQEQPRLGLGSYLPQLSIEQEIGINLIVRRMLFAAQFIIWFVGIATIFQRFPQTYAAGNWLLRVPLAYIGIPIGITLLKSVVDTILRLNIKRIEDRILESGNANVRLQARARTIGFVLEELTKYLAVIFGLLVFFYIIKALNIILITFGAIAFISQDLLKDIRQTYFILIEDHYALGDWIEIGDVSGQVEKISLRASQVRSARGDLFIIAHGSFSEVTNLSHGYSGIDLRIDVAYKTNLNQAMVVIKEVAKQMQQDSPWSQYILAVKMKGVENFGDNSITILLRLHTEAAQHWDVGREYRRRLKPAFDQAGIEIPFPQRSIWFQNALISPRNHDEK